VVAKLPAGQIDTDSNVLSFEIICTFEVEAVGAVLFNLGIAEPLFLSKIIKYVK
jgi:hypothetical protein